MSGAAGFAWGGAWGSDPGSSSDLPGVALLPGNAWQYGWATLWGATSDESTPPQGETAEEALHRALRFVVRSAMGMPPGSVRPANQMSPTGAVTDEYATVMITGKRDVALTKSVIGQANDAPAPSDQRFVEVLDTLSEVDASIQFFKSAKADGAGQPMWSLAGFGRAMRLPLRLRFDRVAAIMRAMNIALIDCGPARDLSEIVNGAWQSRGQVDASFYMVSREVDAAEIITSAEIDGQYEGPGQPPRNIGTIEVTT